MLVLSGERVSDLDRLSLCQSGDEFLISRHYNLSSDKLFSRRLKYESIVVDAVDNLCAALHLSSAAFVEKADYSRKNHGHDYSTVHVYARPLSAIAAVYGMKINLSAVSTLAKLNALNDGVLETAVVYDPGQRYDAVEDIPAVGELKFMAHNQLYAININDPDFDGWVYPNGAEYSKSDFPSAYAVYGDGQSKSFRVPFLSNFIKLNPGVDMTDPIKKVPASNEAIAAHTHGKPQHIDGGKSKKIIVDIKIPATSTCSQEAYKDEIELLETIHLGDDADAHGTMSPGEYEIKNIKESGLTVSGGRCSTEEVNIETVPNYNLLPVMVYIGKKAK